MTNEQIASKLQDIHDSMRRHMDIVYAHLEAIQTVSDAPHTRLHNALDGLYYVALDVRTVKEALESGQTEQEQEDKS